MKKRMARGFSRDESKRCEHKPQESGSPEWFDISSTRAAQNRFFRLCAANATPIMRGAFTFNWYAISECFCLESLQYLGLLAKLRVSCKTNLEAIALEKALAVAVDIGAGEFGFGQYGREGFHYNMLARLGELPFVQLNEYDPHVYMKAPETNNLLDWISEAFSEVHLGAGVLRVIECTAFDIVLAMDRLFPAGLCVTRGWSDEQREYISIHLKLEPIHAVAVETLIDALAWSEDARSTIDKSTAKTCNLLGEFWDRMALDVFGPEKQDTKDRE